MKWIVGMRAAPNLELVSLYQRARICRAFPAYRLHELRDLPAAELLWAIELLDAERKAAR